MSVTNFEFIREISIYSRPQGCISAFKDTDTDVGDIRKPKTDSNTPDLKLLDIVEYTNIFLPCVFLIHKAYQENAWNEKRHIRQQCKMKFSAVRETILLSIFEDYDELTMV